MMSWKIGLDTSPCVFEGDITGSEQCPGLYLYQVSVTPRRA